jgi:glutamyl-tRNA synthetase
MTATLTVPSKQSPFPFAAIVIAAHTGKAEVVFDETASGIALTLDGTTITSEEDVVQALAKEGGLSEDSAKVSLPRRVSGTHITER